MSFILSMNPAQPLPFLPASPAGAPRRSELSTPLTPPLPASAGQQDEELALIERLLAYGSL
jgi:hypothetical protein